MAGQGCLEIIKYLGGVIVAASGWVVAIARDGTEGAKAWPTASQDGR